MQSESSKSSDRLRRPVAGDSQAPFPDLPVTEPARPLEDELRQSLHDEPISERRIGRMQRIWRWCQRKPTAAILTVAVSSLLIAGAVMGVARYRKTSLALAAEVRQRDAADAVAARARAAESVARDEAEQNRRLLYDADMQLAAQMWDSDYSNAKAVLELMNA